MPQTTMEADLQYLQESDEPGLFLSPELAHEAGEIARLYESEDGKNDGWQNTRLSWKGLKRMAVQNYRKLGEAHPATAFGQLLRAGVQLIANNWYTRYEATWTLIAETAESDKRQEFYAPLFSSALPRKVGAGQPFREQEVVGQDLELINVKYGGVEAFTRELFDDDQTSQIRRRAQSLGSSMAVWEDIYFSRAFIGVEDTNFPETIPASKWTGVNSNGTAITTPFDVQMYKNSGPNSGNRPAAFKQFSYQGMTEAFNDLRNALDPLGVKIVVTPNTLLVSTFDEINVETFLKSNYNPAVTPAAGGAETGFMKGTFAANPFYGKVKPVVNVYFPNGAWSLCQSQQGFIFQRRDPLEITQEVPNSGESFTNDTLRFRSRGRWQQDWIDPRFAWLGNDGSAALTQ